MMFPTQWGALDWLPLVIFLIVACAGFLIWSYARSQLSTGWKLTLAGIKLLAVGLLGICLLEPLSEFERVEPGSNLVVILADSSQSLQIKDRGSQRSRHDELASALSDSPWLSKMEDLFDVRKYQFDDQLQPLPVVGDLKAEGSRSSLLASLQSVEQRYRDRPVAGVVVFTDGNATDWDPKVDLSQMPPVYAVTTGKSAPARDLGITDVTTSQTNFESAPVTITVEAMTHGFSGQTVIASLHSSSGEELQRKEIQQVKDATPFAVRFQLKPEDRGVNFYTVKVTPKNEADQDREATQLNNQRKVIVDRGRGPFRVLYVTGRPNWEYKFMRRALADDHEVELVGLIRLAKKEPKFSFRSHADETTNPLFRGFGNEDDQTAEQYDEPVIIRLDCQEDELRDGFPKDEESLFKYDAIVIDDLEAEYFTQDQKSLLQQFVSRRGGGLLMLGGQESFGQGDYDRTAIGEMLPVYLDRDGPSELDQQYQLQLTREGWIQPWVRVNATESAERRRLAEMPGFQTVNTARSIKPGASVLATVKSDGGDVLPALAVQKYGRGKTSAILLGDLWRWQLATKPGNDDLKKSWRQTMRWLVSEVPRRVEVEIEPNESGFQSVSINVNVSDEAFRPLDNAGIELTIKTPGNQEIALTAEMDDQAPGKYVATFVAQEQGPYRVTASATNIDGSPIESRESGWVVESDGAEFERLVPNQNLMETIAERTGGQVIPISQVHRLSERMESAKAPRMVSQTEPWWHRWSIFALAIGLLISEWGLRRWKGLA